MSNPQQTHYAQCARCLSVLEIAPWGGLMPEDARQNREELGRWRKLIQDCLAEMRALTGALREQMVQP